MNNVIIYFLKEKKEKVGFSIEFGYSSHSKPRFVFSIAFTLNGSVSSNTIGKPSKLLRTTPFPSSRIA